MQSSFILPTLDSIFAGIMSTIVSNMKIVFYTFKLFSRYIGHCMTSALEGHQITNLGQPLATHGYSDVRLQ